MESLCHDLVSATVAATKLHTGYQFLGNAAILNPWTVLDSFASVLQGLSVIVRTKIWLVSLVAHELLIMWVLDLEQLSD